MHALEKVPVPTWTDDAAGPAKPAHVKPDQVVPTTADRQSASG